MKKLKLLVLIFLLTSVSVFSSRSSLTETIKEDKLTPENILNYIEEIGIIHSKIVYKQAIVETGWFKSKLCVKHNNLFGMHYTTKRPNKISGYIIADHGAKCAVYKHWKDSIEDYLLYQQYWIDKGKDLTDYYKFLSSIGYASNINYIKILKQIKI